MGIVDSRLLALPTKGDARGRLTFIESSNHVPFDIRRVFYMYELPAGAARGAHAHRNLQQFMIPVYGGFDVLLDDGQNRCGWRLESPDQGLLVAAMTWTVLENFSPHAVCCVLASAPYDESDYVRDYDDFIETVRARR